MPTSSSNSQCSCRTAKTAEDVMVKIAKNLESEQLSLLVIYKMGQRNEKKFFSKVAQAEQ